jgi:hypothetical protein
MLEDVVHGYTVLSHIFQCVVVTLLKRIRFVVILS